VRKFAMDVRELDIDLIDRINPFQEAYAILAKTMSEESLKQVAAAIAKRTSLTPEEAKELAVRAVAFKKERGRPPSISSSDAWEKRMAEGAAAFVRFKKEGRYDGDLDLDELRDELGRLRRSRKRRSGAGHARNASSPDFEEIQRFVDEARSRAAARRGPRHLRAALCRAA
jgi:hypothetical protein